MPKNGTSRAIGILTAICICTASRSPGSEVGRPAKIITQSPHNIERLEIFGQQDYIKTSKPESMSGKEIYRWVTGNSENMN